MHAGARDAGLRRDRGRLAQAQDLAVTFLDRYGNEIGQRGIRHDDSCPLDELPDHVVKAVLATEDRRFYEHFGIDPSAPSAP